jgi:biopolymer transport protein ExbB
MLGKTSIWPKLLGFLLLAAMLLLIGGPLRNSRTVLGQEGAPAASDEAGPAPYTGDEAAAEEPPAESAPSTPAPPAAAPGEGVDPNNLLQLLIAGGFYMIPLAFLSVLVVMFSIERAFGLRKSRVIPKGLIAALGRLSNTGGFDPRKVYRLCQEHPSATANVIRAMLLKVGRPHSEVEHTVAEASQREADRLYANVRYLTMSAGVAPLIGLLGTVWGMILAFHEMTVLAPGQNKALELAEGIYIALVTTLGGLCVAIPAAVIAHYFEGRIQTMFREIDELMFNLLPQIERYEGRVRFSRPGSEPEEPSREPAPPPVDNRRPAVPAPK